MVSRSVLYESFSYIFLQIYLSLRFRLQCVHELYAYPFSLSALQHLKIWFSVACSEGSSVSGDRYAIGRFDFLFRWVMMSISQKSGTKALIVSGAVGNVIPGVVMNPFNVLKGSILLKVNG